MKTLKVEVVYEIELDINERNGVVKEYESENEMLVDCASYGFANTLPVINSGGVTVKNIDLISIT
jgi:hypothetical protein